MGLGLRNRYVDAKRRIKEERKVGYGQKSSYSCVHFLVLKIGKPLFRVYKTNTRKEVEITTCVEQ